MTANTQEILSKVLDLSPIEKAELVEEILSSFNFPNRQTIDNQWAEEVEDRISAYDRGELKAKPIQDVFEAYHIVFPKI